MAGRLQQIDVTDFGRDGAPAKTVQVHRLTILAAAMALGIAAGWHQADMFNALVWPWLIASSAFAASGVIVRWRAPHRHVLAITALGAAMFALGGGWITLQQHFTSPDDLAAMIGDESTLVRVQGTALAAPVLRNRIGGALAKFDYRQPSTYFPLRVDSLIDRDGATHPVRGEVLVRVDASVQPFRAGDHVQAVGFLLRPAPPRNPGEFDYRAYARSLGQAGFLTVAQRELLVVTPARRGSIISVFLNWRDQLRRRAGAWLLADLPHTTRTERDSLLASILLGQRDEQIDGVYSSFQRVGLAHLLAISGFHLGVLAGFVLLLARIIGGSRRWHGFLVIAFVLGYLLLIEARMPVLRAGMMTVVASLGLVFSRRLHASGLVALSGIGLLLWRPDQLFSPGFQLTFGIVLGLIHLTPIVRRRMFGRHNPEAPSTSAMLVQWLYSATAVSLTAWLIAAPIAMFHFGLISPWGVLLSIVTIPLAAVILALGFLKMLFAAILPSAAMLLGVPLSISTDILIALVVTVDSLPLSVIPIANPSSAWSLAAVLCACWWLAGDSWLRRLGSAVKSTASRASLSAFATQRRLARGLRWSFTLALLAWLFWPAGAANALRIDMFAVGDGSCFVVRSGSSTVIFDAGSSTDLNVARRSLIPAMRRLGVRSVDAILISHPDMDHYSAVLELAEEFAVSKVIVTQAFLDEALAVPDGSVNFVMEQLTANRVSVQTIIDGETREFGHAKWHWLHPPLGGNYQRNNDGSMVIRIECAGRRVLLCGDIMAEAMHQLLRPNDDGDLLRADVMELPHHGSYLDIAANFVERVNPSVVMQSTGWARWQRDRWAKPLANTQRLITARDGACWVEIRPDGTLHTGKFLEQSLQSGDDSN